MDLTPVTYFEGGLALTGWMADGSGGKPAPGVLVLHDAQGMSDLAKERALGLAARGFIGFALDMYGTLCRWPEEAAVYYKHLMDDAKALRHRARAGLDVLLAHPHVDRTRIAALGFAFGGTVALEMARDGAPIRCVIGVHPGLKRPKGSADGPVSSHVLMLLGDDDPVVPPEDRLAFGREMKAAGADWQLLLLGGVGHSFTNPKADASGIRGFAYDKRADRRAWNMSMAFIEELF